MYQPFSLTLAVGNHGLEVAKAVHTKTGWFPNIRTIHVARREANGHYQIISTNSVSIKKQVVDIHQLPLAIVDDSLYSGLTLSTLISYLKSEVHPKTVVFFLAGLNESLAVVKKRCSVRLAASIQGRRDKEVSLIRASGLFKPGAILPSRGKPLAFYQRTQWMRAWFPENYRQIISVCHQLRNLSTSQH